MTAHPLPPNRIAARWSRYMHPGFGLDECWFCPLVILTTDPAQTSAGAFDEITAEDGEYRALKL